MDKKDREFIREEKKKKSNSLITQGLFKGTYADKYKRFVRDTDKDHANVQFSKILNEEEFNKIFTSSDIKRFFIHANLPKENKLKEYRNCLERMMNGLIKTRDEEIEIQRKYFEEKFKHKKESILDEHSKTIDPLKKSIKKFDSQIFLEEEYGLITMPKPSEESSPAS